MTLKHKIILTDDSKKKEFDGHNIIYKIGIPKTIDILDSSNNPTGQQQTIYDETEKITIPLDVFKEMKAIDEDSVNCYLKGQMAYKEAVKKIRDDNAQKPKPTLTASEEADAEDITL